jgi:NAD(P)-dependent dehydrogenase (short-subunit alcohol dehydrogenase family)
LRFVLESKAKLNRFDGTFKPDDVFGTDRMLYHASKHGVIGLTKSAALEYAARGIRINAVCPGTIETQMVADMLATEPENMKDILKEQPIGRPA